MHQNRIKPAPKPHTNRHQAANKSRASRTENEGQDVSSTGHS